MSLKTLLFTYLIGGLTLPPLLLAAAIYILWRWAPPYLDDEDQEDVDLSDTADLRMTELEEKSSLGVHAFKCGWITVTREYHEVVSNAMDKQVDFKDSASKNAYTALYKLVKKKDKDEDPQTPGSPTSSTASTNKPPKQKKKNRFYGVLRHGNLFLYKNEDEKDVQHVIVLANNVVTIWPRGLKDSELFTKRTAISILKPQPRHKPDQPPKSSAASLADNEATYSTIDVLEGGIPLNKNMGFFIYCDTNYEKEDWYFELIKATKRGEGVTTGTELDDLNPSVYANALHFKTSDVISLIQTIHSSEGQLQTRWLNAIIGRLYLALQQTDVFEKYVESKILKKLSKINKPGFLEEFQVKKIDIGNSAPFISFPKLQTLNPDGTLRVSFHFTYTGKLSLQISTKANIPNFSTFQKRDLNILLAVTVNKIEGPVVVSLKPPPSNRLWYAFEAMPELDLTIEPVVSQRQFSYGVVTNVIEKKFKDAIKESLVEPYWDDITFFNTSDEFYRGGIWNTKKRPEPNTQEPDEETTPVESNEPEYECGLTDDASGTVDSEHLHAIVSDVSSMRSTGSQGTANKASMSTIRDRKKSEASRSTTHDQYLSDGSYVSREVLSQDSGDLSDSASERKSTSTLQTLSAETSAGKKAISNGMKKIGKWYNEKSRSGNLSKKDREYNPPEMISSRRVPINGEKGPERKTSTGDVRSIGSSDTAQQGSLCDPSHKTAPQAHTFPREYMYGMATSALDNEHGTKHSAPARIPDMKMPGSATESNFAPLSPSLAPVSPKLAQRRKPVSEDKTIERLGQDSKSSSDGKTIEKSKIVPAQIAPAPPSLPSRVTDGPSDPPHLPPRLTVTPPEPIASPVSPVATTVELHQPLEEPEPEKAYPTLVIPPILPPRDETQDTASVSNVKTEDSWH